MVGAVKGEAEQGVRRGGGHGGGGGHGVWRRHSGSGQHRPSGGAVERGEHQRDRPVSTRVKARPRTAQGQPVACDGG